jgi:hypothetical protein
MNNWLSLPLEHGESYPLKEIRPKKLLKYFRVLKSLFKILWLAYYNI